jgi:hypothetical protein
MTWDGAAGRAALAATLTAGLEFRTPTVSVFAKPPATYNAPALVVAYPNSVSLGVPSFGIDLVSHTVIAAVGVDQGDDLDTLLRDAGAAIKLDPTLGGAVQMCKPVEHRNYRIANVAGVDLLTAELALETRA